MESLTVRIDKMDNLNEEVVKLKYVYSILLTISNTNTLKIKLKDYLENQNNELKSDRIITITDNIKSMNSLDAELLRSHIPIFIHAINDANITNNYNETLNILNNSPLIFYEILNIFYLREYRQIYELIDSILTSNFGYWCVIM